MDKKYNDIDVEFAIRVLNHSTEVDDREVDEWLRSEDHRRLLDDLRRIREGSLRATDDNTPNVEAEWKKLDQKISGRRTMRMYRWAATAACVGVLFTVGWLWYQPAAVERVPFARIVPEEQNHATKGVTLVLNDGEEIDLNRENGDLLMQCLPQTIASIATDSLEGLIYTSHKTMSGVEDMHTLRVPRGGEYFVVLDDGTKVWLNAETQLRYPVVFGERERTVELSGEAYFQVSKDKNRPFVVKTKGLQTRVLGTEFNVQAYSPEKANVTLVNGRVAVKIAGKSKEVVLKPRENALLHAGSLEVAKVDIMKYVSWKEGYFYYDNERLEDILTDLGRWYNFTVTYEDPGLKELRFKFWVDRKETFRKVLVHLNEMGKLKIENRNNNIVVFK